MALPAPSKNCEPPSKCGSVVDDVVARVEHVQREARQAATVEMERTARVPPDGGYGRAYSLTDQMVRPAVADGPLRPG